MQYFEEYLLVNYDIKDRINNQNNIHGLSRNLNKIRRTIFCQNR